MVAFTRTRRRTAVGLGAAGVLTVGLIFVQTPGAAAGTHTTGAPEAAADVLPTRTRRCPSRNASPTSSAGCPWTRRSAR